MEPHIRESLLKRVAHAREVRKAKRLELGFESLRAFVARTGNADVPVTHIEGTHKLGSWVSYIRAKYAKGELPDEVANRLESFKGWSWKGWEWSWSEAISQLRQFIAREGHARVPPKHLEGSENFPLGLWASRQRYRMRSGRLTDERMRELQAIPEVMQCWTVAEFDRSWERKLAAVLAFAERNGHTNIPRNHMENGEHIGIWANSMRSQYNRGTLNPARVALLQAIPEWHWARPRPVNVPSGVKRLKVFAKKFGHANPSPDYVDSTNFALGDWVVKCRLAHERGKLTPEQINLVQTVPGWMWKYAP